ncbi:hypothetical protein JL720_1086 [Aureococcus anophagefferens]|nr:hypothetical protein JL720_1086 [Aureococcus anophagefferens]
MGGAYARGIGRSKRLERRRAAVGLGAFFVVVGTLGWNRKSLGAGAPASARGASRRQAPSASPREVGSAKPWQADAAAFPSNLRLSVSGSRPSRPSAPRPTGAWRAADPARRRATLGELAAKHSHGPGCSPFHGGVSFFTAHAAFTLQLDASLRAVDAELRAPTPYWDFTIDGAAFGARPYGWNASSVFADDYFGPARAGARRAARGRPRPRPAPAQAGGRASAAPTSGTRFVPAWAACSRAGSAWTAGFLEPAGPNATALACPAYDGAAATARDVLARAGYLGAVRDPSTGACAVASDFVDARRSSRRGADGRCAARLAPALATDAAADDAFFALAGDVACARRRPLPVSEGRRSDVPQANGAVGAFATGAAPNDPLFWPLHPAFDRILALARLGGARLDEAWPDGTCAGARRETAGEPDQNFEPLRHIDATRRRDAVHARDLGDAGGGGALLTNGDLYDLVDPRRDDLSYVYDAFAWDHCAAAISAALAGDAPDAASSLADVPASKLAPRRSR